MSDLSGPHTTPPFVFVKRMLDSKRRKISPLLYPPFEQIWLQHSTVTEAIKYARIKNTRRSFLPEDHKPRLWRLLRVPPIVVSVSHAAPLILEEREQREQSRIAFEHESEDLNGKAFQVGFDDTPSL